jgi:hypothetical protein
MGFGGLAMQLRRLCSTASGDDHAQRSQQVCNDGNTAFGFGFFFKPAPALAGCPFPPPRHRGRERLPINRAGGGNL